MRKGLNFQKNIVSPPENIRSNDAPQGMMVWSTNTIMLSEPSSISCQFNYFCEYWVGDSESPPEQFSTFPHSFLRFTLLPHLFECLAKFEKLIEPRAVSMHE